MGILGSVVIVINMTVNKLFTFVEKSLARREDKGVVVALSKTDMFTGYKKFIP